MRTSIKVINGALDVIKIDGEESIVLRGVVDPDSLHAIKIPPYQREILSAQKIQALKRALVESRVPDVDIGMRGEGMVERDGAFYLQDPVYVIDGLQRITAGRELVEADLHRPHIGALIHFSTTERFERERFEALNSGQTTLSNNVTLRNLAATSTAAKTMLRITRDKQFVLCGRVSWTQNMHRGDLITAITYYKVVGLTHSHIGPCRGNVRQIANGLDKVIENVGRNVFMHNVRAFFEMIEATFGIKNVAYRQEAVQLKVAFLRALAGLVSKHENFWNDNRIEVPDHILRKLATFPIDDPTVRQLAGSAGKATDMLEMMIHDHVNAGKRTRRLKRRSGLHEYDVDSYETDEDDS